jgi:hypothetical protein
MATVTKGDDFEKTGAKPVQQLHKIRIVSRRRRREDRRGPIPRASSSALYSSHDVYTDPLVSSLPESRPSPRGTSSLSRSVCCGFPSFFRRASDTVC